MKLICFCILLFTQTAFAQSKATKKLFTAIAKNNFALAQNALADGADPTAPLLKATELNRVKIVNLLLNHHANVNVRNSRYGVTPLMIAAHKDFTVIAQLLIIFGADLNAKNSYGQTPLQVSAYANSLSVGQLLLNEKETDVNAGRGACALAVATKEGHTGFVLLLKKQSGAKASSPFCVEEALSVAKNKKLDHINSILMRD